MNAKKFYAVKSPIKNQIFDSWEECKKNTIGVKGVVYKSFLSYDAAVEWLDKKTKSSSDNDYEALAYTDGSFKNDVFSYGAIVIVNNKKYQFNEKFERVDLIKFRNIAGEIMGVVKVIQFAIEQKISSLLIYHDLQHLSEWVDGSYKTNSKLAEAYQKFVNNAKQQMIIEFKKVKAHSNNEYNDIADKLAKEALDFNIVSKSLLD